MNDSLINKIRQEIETFLKGSERIYEFTTDCPLEERLRFLNRTVFTRPGRARFYFRHFIGRIVQFIDYSPVKIAILRMLGVKIGKGVFISPEVIIDMHFPELINIEDYVILGYGSKIFCHDYDGRIYRIGRVDIGRGTVVGGFSLIRAGVTIPENSLVRLTSTILRDPVHARH